jgi:hypothetical protein
MVSICREMEGKKGRGQGAEKLEEAVWGVFPREKKGAEG